jgi:bacterioferritin-associated ferredoxin
MTKVAVVSGAHAATDRVICACFEVKESEIRAFFANPQATVEDFVLTTGATTKCTACAIDFDLVVESLRTGTPQHRRPRQGTRDIHGTAVSDLIDSGFIINKDSIDTVLRIDNRPNAFDPTSQDSLSSYDWRVRIFNEEGALCDRFEGHLEVGKSLTIELTKRLNCPQLGWFWVWLEPKTPGYFGASRPQLALLGPDWVATVHTQPHASACYRKVVAIQRQTGSFRTLVSIINGSRRRPASCELTLSSVSGGSEDKRTVIIPANGSRLVAVDELFRGTAGRMPEAVLVVKSDQPVRKHVIKIQPSGYYSIDHFPDAK